MVILSETDQMEPPTHNGTNGEVVNGSNVQSMKRKMPSDDDSHENDVVTLNGVNHDDENLASKKLKSESGAAIEPMTVPAQNGVDKHSPNQTSPNPVAAGAGETALKPMTSDEIERLRKILILEDANLLLLKKLKASQQRPTQQALQQQQQQQAAVATTQNQQNTQSSTVLAQQEHQQRLLQLQANQIKAQQQQQAMLQRRNSPVVSTQNGVSTNGVIVRPNVVQSKTTSAQPGASLPPNVVPNALFRGPPPAVTPSLAPKPQIKPPDPQAAAKREQAAKLALKKQLEKTLLQIPPPRPPPSNLDFLPWPTIEFLYLVGLEETVNKVLINTHVRPDVECQVQDPFECHQCHSDFTTVWKKDPETGHVICEQCLVNNNKKAVKKEHTNRLKLAVENALQQEKEIIQKLKEEERKNALQAAAQAKVSLPQNIHNNIQTTQLATKQFVNPSPPSQPAKGRILNPAPAPPSRSSIPPGMRPKY